MTPRCPYCAKGERPLFIGGSTGWVQAFHGEASDRYYVIDAICEEWNRFVDTDPQGTGR